MTSVVVEDEIRATTDSSWHTMCFLLWMPVCSLSGVAAVQDYLGLEYDPGPMLMVGALTLFTYAFNRLTDAREDARNDPTRKKARGKAAMLVVLSVVVTVGTSAVALRRRHQLRLQHAIYAAIFVIGLAYSAPLVPVVRGRAFGWLRLKDILFVKSLVVAAVWTTALFVTPALHAPCKIRPTATFVVLGITFFIAYLSNVVYCDMRDEAGDRVANVITIPIRYGTDACHRAIRMTGTMWFAGAAVASLVFQVGAPSALPLVALAGVLYPWFVWFLREKRNLGPRAMDYVVESIVPVFALGLWLLPRHQYWGSHLEC